MCAQCLTDSYGIKLQKMVSLSLLQLLTVKNCLHSALLHSVSGDLSTSGNFKQSLAGSKRARCWMKTRHACKTATQSMIRSHYWPWLNDTSRAARGGGGSFKNRKPIGKIRCCESRNVFVGGNSKTATAVKNLDAITECEAHDYCFANCFQTCQEGPFSVDFTVCSNLGIWPRSKTCTNCSTFQLTNGLVD